MHRHLLPPPFASLSFPTLRALLHSPPPATLPPPLSLLPRRNESSLSNSTAFSLRRGAGGGGRRGAGERDFPTVLTVRPDTYTFIPNHSVRIGNCAALYTTREPHCAFRCHSPPPPPCPPPPRRWPTRAVISHLSYPIALPLSRLLLLLLPPLHPPPTARYIRSARALPDVP